MAQLAQDRAELQMKLAKLEVLVKKVVVKEEGEETEVVNDQPKCIINYLHHSFIIIINLIVMVSLIFIITST